MKTEIERHCLKYVIQGWWEDLDSTDLTTRMCAWNRLHGALIVAEEDKLVDELRLLHDVALQRENDRVVKEQP